MEGAGTSTLSARLALLGLFLSEVYTREQINIETLARILYTYQNTNLKECESEVYIYR